MSDNMEAIVRTKYLLQGLDCADCSQKLERELHKRGFPELQINFAAKSITLEENKVQAIRNIISQVDPGVTLMRAAAKPEERSIRSETLQELGLIAVAALLFLLALFSSEPGAVKEGLFLAAYLTVGTRVLLQAGKNIFRGQIFDENFLMGVASLGAIAVGQYSEAVGVMLFYAVGEFFQDLAVNRSRDSIRALLDIRPDYANVEENGQLKTMAPEDVAVGSCIVIKPGEKIPLDGTVITGSAFIDTSSLTGEATPKRVEAGDQVLAGTVNTNSLIKVRVSKRFADSSLARIFELVENAAIHKAPTEKFITRFSRYYTPAVVAASVVLALLPPLIIPGASFAQWTYRALILLVISCPCALVLSVPLGYFGGIGAASKQGILIKGSNYLEALTKLHTVVVDKTGTLTKGEFKVKTIIPAAGFSAEQVLQLAAHAEAYSAHPIAKSIAAAYSGPPAAGLVSDYEERAGRGVIARINGARVLVGSEQLLRECGINLQVRDGAEKLPPAGGTAVHVAQGTAYAGRITIADEIRPDALQAVRGLKAAGVQDVVMLSGDDETEVSRVADALEIKQFQARLLPEDKVTWVEKLEGRLKKGATLAFIGDGINDAPVLAKAHIGVAMGGLGSDAAIEAADVVLMEDRPGRLVTAISIAQKTRTIVIENIIFALGFKLILLVLGALGFATMWEAVFADVGVALIAILNSARTLSYKA